jgi:hypothetical protein
LEEEALIDLQVHLWRGALIKKEGASVNRGERNEGSIRKKGTSINLSEKGFSLPLRPFADSFLHLYPQYLSFSSLLLIRFFISFLNYYYNVDLVNLSVY